MKTKFLKSIGLALLGLSILPACQSKHHDEKPGITESNETAPIEVIYFYGKQRCVTCMAMEKFAKEAVDSVFRDKINDGTIIFKSVDITTPEGERLADRFEVSSSSLYIVDNNPNNPEKIDMTAFGFRNARNNRHAYKQGIIDIGLQRSEYKHFLR